MHLAYRTRASSARAVLRRGDRDIADHYRDGWATLRGMGYPPPLPEGDPREHVMPKVIESAEYLGGVLDQVNTWVGRAPS
jgi:hypothetical protein